MIVPVPVLTIVGEFIANADSTIIMAAAGPISSQFDRLQDANWLSTAYTLGLCASQPLVREKNTESTGSTDVDMPKVW